MRFYAFEYMSGKQTTTGQPNKLTGRLNIAGKAEVFYSRKARDEWVENGQYTSDMGGNCRVSLTKKRIKTSLFRYDS